MAACILGQSLKPKLKPAWVQSPYRVPGSPGVSRIRGIPLTHNGLVHNGLSFGAFPAVITQTLEIRHNKWTNEYRSEGNFGLCCRNRHAPRGGTHRCAAGGRRIQATDGESRASRR